MSCLRGVVATRQLQLQDEGGFVAKHSFSLDNIEVWSAEGGRGLAVLSWQKRAYVVPLQGSIVVWIYCRLTFLPSASRPVGRERGRRLRKWGGASWRPGTRSVVMGVVSCGAQP